MSDPYQRLGLQRGADARAIKTAYFALVRKHPPEQDPEAFQQIRAAYDLLSDPERRAAYDAERERHSEHGAEAQALLRAAEECLESDRPEAARDLLKRLLEGNPELAEARKFMAMALHKLGDTQGSLAELEWLVQHHPAELEYRLHLAYALRGSGQLPRALEAARDARGLAPRDANAALLLGDLHAQLKEWQKAAAEYGEALANSESKIDAMYARLRVVGLYSASRDGKRMRSALDDLEKALQSEQDADLRRFVATRVAGLAADGFANDRVPDANLLLSWAGRLSPSPVFEAAMPSRAKVLLADLPVASREALAKLSPSTGGRFAKRLSNGVFLLAVGVAVLVLCGKAIASSTAPSGWDGAAVIGFSVLAFAATAAFSFAVRRLRGADTGDIASGTVLHPLYLLELDGESVTAWPLLRLKGANLTHQHVNGIYSGTDVVLDFGGARYSTRISGQAKAGEWAQGALNARTRALELLQRGLLGEEQGAALIPPALLAEGREATPAERARSRSVALHWAAAAVGAVVFAAIAPRIGARYASEAGWERAWLSGQPAALALYAEQFPNGGHAAEAAARARAQTEQALERAEKRAGKKLPALASLLDAVRSAGKLEVRVVHAAGSSHDPGGHALIDKLLGDAQARDDELEVRLGAAIDAALGRGVIGFGRNSDAVVALRYAVNDSGGRLQAAGGDTIRALSVDCSASVVARRKEVLGVRLAVPSPARLTTTRRALAAQPEAPYRDAIAGSLELCARKLLTELAAAPWAVPPRVQPPPKAGNPYTDAQVSR
jgi:curved DNA-binding protein CbpA